MSGGWLTDALAGAMQLIRADDENSDLFAAGTPLSGPGQVAEAGNPPDYSPRTEETLYVAPLSFWYRSYVRFISADLIPLMLC